MLKIEHYHLLKMNVAFLKYLTNKDLRIPVKIAKKMKTTSCAGSPNHVLLRNAWRHVVNNAQFH